MYDINYPPPPPPPLPAAPKHSVLGIVSFILAILAVTIFCGGVAIYLALGGPGNPPEGFQSIDTIISCGAGFLALVGLGLGIAAVVQKNTKKLFGILGLIFNALYLLAYCVIIVFNLARLSA